MHRWLHASLWPVACSTRRLTCTCLAWTFPFSVILQQGHSGLGSCRSLSQISAQTLALQQRRQKQHLQNHDLLDPSCAVNARIPACLHPFLKHLDVDVTPRVRVRRPLEERGCELLAHGVRASVMERIAACLGSGFIFGSGFRPPPPAPLLVCVHGLNGSISSFDSLVPGPHKFWHESCLGSLAGLALTLSPAGLS